MTTTYRIQKNIPIPDYHKGKPSTVTFVKDMEVGDSFFVTTESIQSRRSSMLQSIKKFCENNKMKRWEFTTRATDKGFRVWRIK